MLKKMCSLVLCVALVATVFTAMPVFANLKPITVSIVPNTQEVAAGGSFSVDVIVDSAGTPIRACEVVVTFDADLTATGLTGADLLGAFGIDAFYIPLVDVGEFSYVGARIGHPIVPIAVNGNFVTIDFDVAGDATGTYPLVVDANLLDAAGDPIAVVENDGEVVVTAVGAASVRIEPETLNLASQGVFTAFITLPEGYDVADIDVSTVECEGAPAVRGMVAGDKFIAKFNRQDLVNVLPGDEVTLTVTGKLTDGTLFVGSDTIRVIDKGGK